MGSGNVTDLLFVACLPAFQKFTGWESSKAGI